MSPNQLAPGTVLDGKWHIEALLGSGGMGSVYAATHLRNGARVALKMLHPEVARDPAARERFLREGYAANRVGHPGVVSVLDDGTTHDGSVFLVMERLEGKPLDVIIDEAGGRLSLDATLRFAIPWLEVVAAAHNAGVVHRDLKPENVFVNNTGVVKVLDFGLARVQESYRQKRLTTTGLMFGTPAFMPPEQALARWNEVDARSDIYSMGASIFTMLTGQLVHSGETVPEIIVAVSTRPAPPVRSVMPALPPGIAAVLDKALQFRRQDRFANAGTMLAALRSAAVARIADLAGRTPAQGARGASFEEEPTVEASMTPWGAQAGAATTVSGAPLVPESTVAMAPVQAPSHATAVFGTPTPTVNVPASIPTDRAKRRATPLLLGAIAVICTLAVGALVIVRLVSGDATTASSGTDARERTAPIPPSAPAPNSGTGAASAAPSDPGPSAGTAASASAGASPGASSSAASTTVSPARPPSAGVKPPGSAGASEKNCYFDDLRQIRVCK